MMNQDIENVIQVRYTIIRERKTGKERGRGDIKNPLPLGDRDGEKGVG